MVIFVSRPGGGAGVGTFGFPDTCKTPELAAKLPIPYAGATTIISVSKERGKIGVKAYRVESGSATALPLSKFAEVSALVVSEDGSVVVSRHVCRTQADARRVVADELGPGATATVVPVGDDVTATKAFRVTSRSVRGLRIEVVASALPGGAVVGNASKARKSLRESSGD